MPWISLRGTIGFKVDDRAKFRFPMIRTLILVFYKKNFVLKGLINLQLSMS